MHVPMGIVADAIAKSTQLRADCAVAVGGGSTIGLGKALALYSDLSVIAIPTTYTGSEMTPIFGITDNGLKKTGTDKRVLPKTVIYDPDLTLGLPVNISVTSAINAIAHAAKGMYAKDESDHVHSRLRRHYSTRRIFAAPYRALPRIVPISWDEPRLSMLRGCAGPF
jgi:maleylacetate reductase